MVITLLCKNEGWIGPYGLGLAAGFLLIYFSHSSLISVKQFQPVSDTKVMVLAKTLTG